MKICRLFLPGHYEDAHLYMDRLVALTDDQTLRFFNLNRLVAAIDHRYPALAPVATFMFSRNDWMAAGPFRAMLRNQAVRKAFLDALADFPQPYLTYNPDDYSEGAVDLGIRATAILDMRIYSQRVYIASSHGLYDVDIDWSPEHLVPINKVRKRHEARCVSASVGYGAINASCGDEGLFCAFDDFGWASESGDRRELAKVSPKSLRTAWMTYDLANYASPAALPEVFFAKKDKANVSDAHEKSVVTSLNHDTGAMHNILSDLRQRHGIRTSDMQFVFNSRSSLFIATFEGTFLTVSLARSQDGEQHVARTAAYEQPVGRALGIEFCSVGTVVETEDRVLLFADGEWITLIDSEVLSVRTFKNSKRYKSTVTIVTEDGIYVIALFDEAR